MPRGSNGKVEEARVSAKEMSKERASGKGGSGARHYEKEGFGGGSMQKNPKAMGKNSF